MNIIGPSPARKEKTIIVKTSRKLTQALAANAQITIPVFPPDCQAQFGDAN